MKISIYFFLSELFLFYGIMENQFLNKNTEKITYYKQKLLNNDNDYESSYNLAEVFWSTLEKLK